MTANHEESVKIKWKVGDVCNLSLIECQACGDRHPEYVMEVTPKGEIRQTSWASEKGIGHPLSEIEPRKYIQQQRDRINDMLKTIRRLRSQIHKMRKAKNP